MRRGRSDVQRDHAPPGGSSMGATAPDMKGVPRALLPKRRADVVIALAERVFLADGENDLQAPDRVQMPRVVEVGEEVARRVEVNGIVVIAVEQITEIINWTGKVVPATKCDQLAEPMGVSQHDVHCVIGPEAATECRHERTGIDLAAEGQDLVQDITFVQFVVNDPLPRVTPPAIKAGVVDAV